jgi:site-specific DNA-methyltransferase (adenine-specific)
MMLLPERSVTTLDTVHCCDCFTLMNGLADRSVDAIITDMPYQVTACTWDKRVDFDRWWTAVKRILKPRGVMVTTASQPFTSMLVMSNLEWFRYEWVWRKNRGSNFLNGKIEPMKEHENILVFALGQPQYYPVWIERKDKARAKYGYKPDVRIKTGHVFGDVNFGHRKAFSVEERTPSSVLEHICENGFHPTQKPVSLYDYLIRTYTQPGDVILDPFMGSGTTGVAALKTGRHYIGCDVSAEYVNLARQRIQNSDPYQASILPTGETQLSLFEVNT